MGEGKEIITTARQEETTTRREFLKRGFRQGARAVGTALGLSALGCARFIPDIPVVQHARADAQTSTDPETEEKPTEIPWNKTIPEYPESPTESNILTYRKELRKVVRKNLEIFANPIYDELLVTRGEALKQHLSIPGYGSISTPFVDLTPEDLEGHARYFITKPGEPSEFFPNIGVGQITKNNEGYEMYGLDISGGFFLGRSVHTDEEGNERHVGYYGLTVGELRKDEPLTKLILTVHYGWRRPDGSLSQDIGFLVRNDSGNYLGPIVAHDGGDLTYLSELLPVLDQSIGDIHHLQINASSYQPGLVSIAESLGYPIGDYTEDYIDSQSQTTLSTFHTLQKVITKTADTQGYEFNTLRDLAPVSTPIPEASPEAQNIDVTSEIGSLPDQSYYLAHVNLTRDKIVELPRVRGVLISPIALIPTQQQDARRAPAINFINRIRSLRPNNLINLRSELNRAA